MEKLLFIHHYGGLGGAGKSLINNLKLLSSNYKIHVIIPRYPSDIDKLISDIDGVEISYFDFIPSLPIYSGGMSLYNYKFYKHIFKSIKYKKLMLNKIKEIDPNILVVNSIILSWIAKFSNNIKTVCFIRETKAKSILNILHKYFLKYFTKVVFLSKYDLESWGLDNDCIVIPNSMDKETELDILQYKRNNKINILFLGGTSYIKGFYFLIFAYFLSKKKDSIKLTIIGTYNDKIKKIFDSFYFKDLNIEFYGNVNNVDDYYINSDAVIFPVVKVHQGRPIFEAGYFHKLVICPSFDNLAEYVENNHNGLIYQKGSIKSLSLILSKIADENINFESLGNNNYVKYLEKHTKTQAKINIFKLFSELK